MIIDSYYLSNDENIEVCLEQTDLSLDELVEIVGRFRKDHYKFAGKLRGEVIEYSDGKIKIRHHFKKNILWEN